MIHRVIRLCAAVFITVVFSLFVIVNMQPERVLAHDVVTGNSFALLGFPAGCDPNVDDDLSGCDFTGQDLSGVDFSGKNLSGAIFTDATLNNTNFSGANLTAAVFNGAQGDNINFSNAKLTSATPVSYTHLRAHETVLD